MKIRGRKNAKKAPRESDATRPEYYNQHELTNRGAWMRSFFSNERVNYGVGVQKRWASERDAYVQLLAHSGGTDGYVFNAGVRWNF